MSVAYLNSLLERRQTITDAATSILDKCAADGVEPTAEQRAQLSKWDGDAKGLDAEIASIEATVRGARKFGETLNRAASLAERTERREADKREAGETAPETRSIGEQFVESEQFKSYSGRGTMARVEFPDFLAPEQRAAITTADLGGPTSTQWAGPAGPAALTPFLSLINREVVSSGSVDYLVWGEATGAAVVAEGALKPEAELEVTPASATLETYAYWKAITRQALEDWPRMRSIVETKMRRGLANTLEAAAVGTLAGATETATEVGLAGIREAIGLVQSRGYSPNAVALNPADFAALDVDIMTSTTSGPSSFGTYWGVRPVPVSGIVAGTAYVGDFSEAVTWFDRASAALYLTDSHADYFIRNMFVLLAEQRSTFALTDAAAVVNVAMEAAEPPAGE